MAMLNELLEKAETEMNVVVVVASPADEAVKSVSSGQAQVLMKGNLPTALILKAVLYSDYGLRTGKILTPIAAFEVPNYGRLLIVTDATTDPHHSFVMNQGGQIDGCLIDGPLALAIFSTSK